MQYRHCPIPAVLCASTAAGLLVRLFEMSMNSEQEDFEELRRLLAIKRHEQPPPGYFHEFSRQVIIRIRAGEKTAAESVFERFIAQAPWLQRLWAGFEAKPILAGAFGVGVCGLLVIGLVSSERIGCTPQ